MGTMQKITFDAQSDGLHNALVITGSRPGPHHGYVREYPSGLPLAHLNWQNDNPVRYLTTAGIGEVTVQIDQDRTYPDDADYKGEQYQIKATPLGDRPRQRKVPSVTVAGDVLPGAVTDPGDARFIAEEDEVPGVDMPPEPNRQLEEARGAQHRAAAVPEQVSEDGLKRVRAMSAEARAAAETAQAQAEAAEAESVRAGRAQKEAESAAVRDERAKRDAAEEDLLARMEAEVLVDKATSVPVVADPPEAAGKPGQGEVPPTAKVEAKLVEQHEDAVDPPSGDGDPADDGEKNPAGETGVEEGKREEHEDAADPPDEDDAEAPAAAKVTPPKFRRKR